MYQESLTIVWLRSGYTDIFICLSTVYFTRSHEGYQRHRKHESYLPRNHSLVFGIVGKRKSSEHNLIFSKDCYFQTLNWFLTQFRAFISHIDTHAFSPILVYSWGNWKMKNYKYSSSKILYFSEDFMYLLVRMIKEVSEMAYRGLQAGCNWMAG